LDARQFPDFLEQGRAEIQDFVQLVVFCERQLDSDGEQLLRVKAELGRLHFGEALQNETRGA
jgi:hypothetical protein